MIRRPKICLSLNCKDLDSVATEYGRYRDYCEMVEWRSDMTEGVSEMNREDLRHMIKAIRKICDGKSVIFTYRGDASTTERLIKYAIGVANYIDIEYENPNVEFLVREAKRKWTKTIVSFHDYEGMPTRDEVAVKYIQMEKTGASVLKLAAFAHTEKDCFTLLEGASAYNQLLRHRPFIAIAMGSEGQTSRICSGDFGSVITFACGSEKTAPGQIDAKELFAYMERYYEK